MKVSNEDLKKVLDNINKTQGEALQKLASDTDSDKENDYSDKVNQSLLRKYLTLTGDTVEMFNRMAKNYIAEKFGNAGTDTEHIAYVESIMNTELSAFEVE